MTIYLAKDSDSVISHCRCERSLVAYPAQADCPWCGCGWLFTCMSCRKAFTFARGVEVPDSLAELALRDRGASAPDSVDDWVHVMESLLSEVKVGERYAYLDGHVLRAALGPVTVSGWHAAHRFSHLPQVLAEGDRSVLERELCQASYWESNAVPS